MILGALSADELCAREVEAKAAFDALPLIDQIRIVVREEVRRAMDDRDHAKQSDRYNRILAMRHKV